MNDEATQDKRTRSSTSIWDVYRIRELEPDDEAVTASLDTIGLRIQVEGVHSNEDRAKEAIRKATERLSEEDTLRYGMFRCYRTDNDAPHVVTRSAKLIPEHVQDEWS